MIAVRVEVLGETGCFTLTVYAENLRRAVQIANDSYPGSNTVRIAFPIEPEDFFAAAGRRGEEVLEAAEEAG